MRNAKVRLGVNAPKVPMPLNPDCGRETVIILKVFFESFITVL
jgi:hypothetical protein